MKNIGVIGDTGMVGQELCKVLEAHDNVYIIYKKNSSRQIGKLSDCELVFLATKDEESMSSAKIAIEAGIRVIDMSGAFRLNKDSFEKWYKLNHSCPDIIEKAVYGMPAFNYNKIQTAMLVANPGCYPTSVILALKPLHGLIEGEVTITSTSGNSGARKTVEDVADEISYSYGRKHKHVPEMEQYSGFRVNFTPLVLRSVFKGINTNIRVSLTSELAKLNNLEAVIKLEDALKSSYTPEDLIFVVRDDGDKQWGTADVNDTHRMLIKVRVEDGFAYINTLIDNLGKGAASQGVENMNIMFGFPRLYGIDNVYSTKYI